MLQVALPVSSLSQQLGVKGFRNKDQDKSEHHSRPDYDNVKCPVPVGILVDKASQ
jgi:hypothetical protein